MRSSGQRTPLKDHSAWENCGRGGSDAQLVRNTATTKTPIALTHSTTNLMPLVELNSSTLTSAWRELAAKMLPVNTQRTAAL